MKVYKFLIEKFSLSFREAQKWIDKNRVYCNGILVENKSCELLGLVEVSVFEPTTKGLSPIFQTEDFAIFDKPSGVLIHPSNRKSIYSLTHEVKYQFGNQANITHRLDRETSGLVIASKSRAVEIYIKQEFEKRNIKKGYLALVRGKIDNKVVVDAPISKNRDFSKIKLKVRISHDGKESRTIIKPIRYFDDKNQTLVEAIPLTGRQHQIRVHLFHIGYPIIGDPIYGVDFEFTEKYLNKTLSDEERLNFTGAKRLMLHANWIDFRYKNRFFIYSQSRIEEIFNLCL